ncbi:MAG: hypothetical protein GEV09_04275 [Pseudonocardiaceae bacterium]|nr:hypothetical protein [Pseudonocardiaceae bacterium]
MRVLLRLPTRVAITVAVVAAVSAWLCAPMAQSAQGSAQAAWLAAGAVLTAVAVGLPLLEQYKARRQRDRLADQAVRTEQQVLVAVQDTLDPFVNLLGRITTASTPEVREPLRAAAVIGLLEAGAQLMGPRLTGLERVRVSFYELDPGPPRCLRPSPFSVGRAMPPTQVFTEGTVLGDGALGLVERGGHRFVADVEAQPPPGWTSTEHDYRTFIAASVGTEAARYGMLTVDAQTPGDLGVSDIPFVRFLAGLLAAALGA